MGNCGTREENAVVAAHAQGIHPFRFAPGFSWATLIGGCLDWISGWALRIASEFRLCWIISQLLPGFSFSWLVGSRSRWMWITKMLSFLAFYCDAFWFICSFGLAIWLQNSIFLRV
jgi:hypothetical protein